MFRLMAYTRLAHDATLSGKKLLAKIVNGVKQLTVFCPFERLVSFYL